MSGDVIADKEEKEEVLLDGNALAAGATRVAAQYNEANVLNCVLCRSQVLLDGRLGSLAWSAVQRSRDWHFALFCSVDH